MKVGSTSQRITLRIADSSSGLGALLTGLVHNSAGLTAYYIKDGDSSATAITLVTATLGTWTSGGFIAVDGTNMPGLYEFGIPNAAIASGVRTTFMFKGATNMVPYVVAVDLTAVDPQSATAFITGVNSISYSAPPTAAANAAALLDYADGIETSLTPRQAFRLIASACVAKCSVSGSTVTFRNIADTKNRITSTTDDNGQRTAITIDAT